MVSERLVRFIDDHTLDLLGRARLSRQIIHHDLRGQEEDTLGSPYLLPLPRRRAAYKERNRPLVKEGERRVLNVCVIIWLPVSSAMCA